MSAASLTTLAQSHGTRQRKSLALLLAPIVIVSVGLFVVPLFSLFVYSFYTHTPGRIMEPILTLNNYRKFFSDPFFLGVLWTTIRIGIVTTLTTILLAYPLAYYFARYPRFRGLQMALLVSPLLVNIVIRVYGWRVLLAEQGLVNRALLTIGIIHEPLQLMNSMTGIIISLVHVLLPYMVLSIATALEGIDQSVEEAAATLGAPRWEVFRRVLVPLSTPGIVAGSILVFTLAAGSFIAPALMGGGMVQTIPTLMYQYSIGLLNWPFGAALAFIMAALTLTALTLYLGLALRGAAAREATS